MIVDPAKQIKCDLSNTLKWVLERSHLICKYNKKNPNIYIMRRENEVISVCVPGMCLFCVFVQPILRLQNTVIRYFSFETKSGMGVN